MTRWLIILILCSLPLTSGSLWAHGNNDHILGTVTETTDTIIVVKTPKGNSVSISIEADTDFQQNGISTKDARPQVGDRLAADVSKHEGQIVGKLIRFTTSKSK